MDINNQNIYKEECRICGPFLVNCCLCTITNLASFILFFSCPSKKTTKTNDNDVN